MCVCVLCVSVSFTLGNAIFTYVIVSFSFIEKHKKNQSKVNKNTKLNIWIEISEKKIQKKYQMFESEKESLGK